MALAIDDDKLNYRAAAGLARVALAQGEVAVALLHVEGLLVVLAGGGTLDGTDQLDIRLSCYQVLDRAGDPRADEMLASARIELTARAAKITDTTLHHSVLDEIPEHREIEAAWVAGQASPQGHE